MGSILTISAVRNCILRIRTMDEKRLLLQPNVRVEYRYQIPSIKLRARQCLLTAFVFVVTCLILISGFDDETPDGSSPAQTIREFQKCSIDTFLATGVSFLDSAS